MSYITFEIPERFLQCMATGALDRCGALIKDVNTGQIVAHLREVIPSEEINNLSENVTSLENRIMEMQSVQKLMAAGLGTISLIAIIGFMYVANKMESLKASIHELSQSLEKVHKGVELLRLENAVALTKNYYRAVAAFKEGQFGDACTYARNCSADIENYMLNMPIGDILANERKLEFLMQFLLLTMRCQIEAAAQLPDTKIHLIYQRYSELFKAIERRLNYKKQEYCALLPRSTEDVAILVNLSRPCSFTNRLMAALPVCHDVLEKEWRFLEMGDSNIICHGKIDDKEYLIALSDSYKPSAHEYAADA